MGSGSTGVSALLLERFFWGYELNKDFFLISERRLKETVNKFRETNLFNNV